MTPPCLIIWGQVSRAEDRRLPGRSDGWFRPARPRAVTGGAGGRRSTGLTGRTSSSSGVFVHRCVQLQSAGQIEIVSTATAPGVREKTATAPGVREKQAWLAAIRRACDASRVITGRDDFAHGTLTTCKLSSTQITVVTADAQSVVQASAHAGRSNGALHVCTPLTGALIVNQDNNQAELLPGQVAMFDSTRPFRLTMHEQFRMVLVRLTHHTIGINPRHTEPLTASRWEVTGGVGAVASNLLTTLGTHLSELGCAAIDPLGSGIRSTIMSLIAERLCQSTAHTTVARQMLMIRIQSWAREHLRDISLTPRALARQHNVSLRYLQMLFAEQDMSPAKWIRNERLAHCYEDLRNPYYDHLTIAALGDRWGLRGGASQVSRLFRELYGCPPSEVRRRRQVAAAS